MRKRREEGGKVRIEEREDKDEREGKRRIEGRKGGGEMREGREGGRG